MADSALVDRELTAEAYDRNGAPILAIAVHMAEGGGTDTWLTRIDGNSSHYVVKYDGRLTQLVPESKAAGSMNPRLTRTTDDPLYTYAGETYRYGRSVLDAVLGEYAAISANRAVIAIEVEGFAAVGPNVAQTKTLTALCHDILARRPTVRGLIGHRDQQAYKACPGKRIPWKALGGHGLIREEEMRPFPVGIDPKVVDLKVGAKLLKLDLTTGITVSLGNDKPSPYTYRTGGVTYRVVVVPTGGVPHLWLVHPDDVLSAQPAPATFPASASYIVEVGGKPVGSVTLP